MSPADVPAPADAPAPDGGADQAVPGMATQVRASPPDGGPVDGEASGPYRLSQTGLYADIERKVLASDVLAFEPTYKLWSDGTEKTRWIVLPAGSRIDSSQMNAWQFPVGTRVWKEFRKAGGRRLETRMIVRTGTERMDYWMGAFLWDEDEKDAVFVVDGAKNVHGTDHDVPEAKRCWSCHQGEPGRLLGFSAVQLSRPDREPNLGWLAAQRWLSNPPAAGESYAPPGAGQVQAALGYLHANCGHCHSQTGIARPDTDQILRLAVEERTPEATAIYRTSIGVKVQKFTNRSVTLRVVPGQPAESALFYRMSRRGTDEQMPPLATKHEDPEGIEIVRRWIESLVP